MTGWSFLYHKDLVAANRTSINLCFGHWGRKDLPNLLWLQSPFSLNARQVGLPFAAHLKSSSVLSSLHTCFLSCADNLARYARLKMIGCGGSTDVPGWFTLTRTNLRICMLMSAQPWLRLTVAVAPTSTERIPSPSQPLNAFPPAQQDG